MMTFELRVPIPASSLIFTLVGRAGSGHEAGLKTGVAPGKGRGGMLLKALASGGAYPTKKLTTKHASKVAKCRGSFHASFLVSFYASLIGADACSCPPSGASSPAMFAEEDIHVHFAGAAISPLPAFTSDCGHPGAWQPGCLPLARVCSLSC